VDDPGDKACVEVLVQMAQNLERNIRPYPLQLGIVLPAKIFSTGAAPGEFPEEPREEAQGRDVSRPLDLTCLTGGLEGPLRVDGRDNWEGK
jgi:hypothetical protein